MLKVIPYSLICQTASHLSGQSLKNSVVLAPQQVLASFQHDGSRHQLQGIYSSPRHSCSRVHSWVAPEEVHHLSKWHISCEGCTEAHQMNVFGGDDEKDDVTEQPMRSYNNGIIKWLELEGTPWIIMFQSPCHRQGHQSPNLVLGQVTQGPIQPRISNSVVSLDIQLPLSVEVVCPTIAI